MHLEQRRRRCSHYIWVINNFIAYQGASHIGYLRVVTFHISIPKGDIYHISFRSWSRFTHRELGASKQIARRPMKLGQIIRSAIHEYKVMNSDNKGSKVASWRDRTGPSGDYWKLLWHALVSTCRTLLQFTGTYFCNVIFYRDIHFTSSTSLKSFQHKRKFVA